MNVIFIIIVTLSTAVIAIKSPDKLIAIMTEGATDAVNLAIKLAAIYAVWLGIYEIIVECKISDKLSKLLKKPVRKLFGETFEAESHLSANISANLLGIGAIATKSGIEAMRELDKQKNEKAKTLLFVISATSIQLFPITVIAIMSANGSQNPSSIFLPSLISTAFSTILGITLTKIFVKK